MREFWKTHKESEQRLKSWYREASNANWESPQDVKLMYPSASILSDNHVVFNIKGNHFRLIVKVNYKVKIVLIRFIGTHADYDKIDAKSI